MRLSRLDDVLFPVETYPVFVSVRDRSGGERRLFAPNRTAIVSTAHQRVLGIVGRDYRLVTNQQALDWAYECCRTVFPETNAAEWDVTATDGPSTGGHCLIDLVHRTARLDFGDVRPGERPDAFGPFIRVTNSYNGSRALAFDIGFHRKVCSNGLIAPDTIVQFKFTHQQRHIGSGIRFDVARERLARLKDKLSAHFAALKACAVPDAAFSPLLYAILRIPTPEWTGPWSRRTEAWELLDGHIHEVCFRYANELGENAYALLNAVTDFASRPPVNRHVHRDRHSLQRLAGSWLSTFGHECRTPGFAIEAYVAGMQATAPA